MTSGYDNRLEKLEQRRGSGSDKKFCKWVIEGRDLWWREFNREEVTEERRKHSGMGDKHPDWIRRTAIPPGSILTTEELQQALEANSRRGGYGRDLRELVEPEPLVDPPGAARGDVTPEVAEVAPAPAARRTGRLYPLREYGGQRAPDDEPTEEQIVEILSGVDLDLPGTE